MNLPRRQIRFCTAEDDTRIAVSSLGKGPPIVRAAHWLSHVEYDPASPVWRPWLEALSKRNTYICYDQRGCGLSDREVDDLCLETLVGDLEAVVDQLGLRRFSLIGMSQGGAIAIAYAVKHPERVSNLVLMGAYARGLLKRNPTREARVEAETLVNLIRLGWGRDNVAFRQVFTSQYIPDGGADQHKWWNDLQREAASPDVAARVLEVLHTLDVTDLARQIKTPTLVMHSRGDARVPFEEGRLLASLIPDARLVALESKNHVILENEPAWSHFLSEFAEFLGEHQDPVTGPSIALRELTRSEFEVLHQIAQGLANGAIAEKLGKSEKTVRNQISSIFSKLGVTSRAEAIVLAREEGLGAKVL